MKRLFLTFIVSALFLLASAQEVKIEFITPSIVHGTMASSMSLVQRRHSPLPGMTIVCGDSHTSTHGAVGAIAMGIGTSEVAQVLASQCILQSKPKTMRINVEGKLQPGVTAKDVALYIMAQMTTSGATGYAVEYAGSVVRDMSMEGRLTLSNLSIEMGSRAGLIAPDETTFAYLKDREYAPKGAEWDAAVARWSQLKSDPDAKFDKEVTYRAEDIKPRITYGTNPGAGIAIDECIPTTDATTTSSC